MGADDSQRPADPPDEEKDRRTGSGDRRQGDRRADSVPVDEDRREGKDRRVAPRRKRSMNQYDLEEDVMELIAAINRFKEQSGRAFPTWTEVLEIVKSLGYEKRT